MLIQTSMVYDPVSSVDDTTICITRRVMIEPKFIWGFYYKHIYHFIVIIVLWSSSVVIIDLINSQMDI